MDERRKMAKKWRIYNSMKEKAWRIWAIIMWREIEVSEWIIIMSRKLMKMI